MAAARVSAAASGLVVTIDQIPHPDDACCLARSLRIGPGGDLDGHRQCRGFSTPAPGGTVTFMSGSTKLGTANLNSKGQATFTTSALAAGSDTVTASYGEPHVQPQQQRPDRNGGPLYDRHDDQHLGRALVFGQAVTFTAAVSGAVSGVGTPTGTVTFMDGKTTLGTVKLSTTGTATFKTSSLACGCEAITASYAAAGKFLASSGSLTQTVNKAVPTILVTASPGPSVYGQAVRSRQPPPPPPAARCHLSCERHQPGHLHAGRRQGDLQDRGPAGRQRYHHGRLHGNASYLAGQGSLTQTVNPAAAATLISTSAKTWSMARRSRSRPRSRPWPPVRARPSAR